MQVQRKIHVFLIAAEKMCARADGDRGACRAGASPLNPGLPDNRARLCQTDRAVIHQSKGDFDGIVEDPKSRGQCGDVLVVGGRVGIFGLHQLARTGGGWILCRRFLQQRRTQLEVWQNSAPRIIFSAAFLLLPPLHRIKIQ